MEKTEDVFDYKRLTSLLEKLMPSIEDPDLDIFCDILIEFSRSFKPLGTIMSFAFSGILKILTGFSINCYLYRYY